MKIPIFSGLITTISNALDPEKKRPTPPTKVRPIEEPERRREEKPSPQSPPSSSAKSFDMRLEEATTVYDCMNLYQNCTSGSPEEEQAASKAFKIATIFADYYTILEMSDIESPVAIRAATRLQNLAQSFEEWKQLLDYIKADASFAEIVTATRRGMASKSSSLDEWLYVYQNSPDGSVEKTTAQAEVLKLAQSDDDWETITSDLLDTDVLHQNRLEWRLNHADDLETIENIYDELSEGDALIPILIAKLNARTDPLDDWIERYKNRGDKDAFDEACFAKMLAFAQDVDDYINVYQVAENAHDDDEQQVLEHIRGLTWEKTEWEKLRDDGSDYGALVDLAFEKLLESETTTADILSFYLDYKENYEESSDVVEKIFEKLFKVATLTEAEIIMILTESGLDDLHEAADKVVSPPTEEKT